MHVYLKDFDYNGSKVIAINTSIRDFGNSKAIRKTSKPENKTKCCTPIMHSKPNEHSFHFIGLLVFFLLIKVSAFFQTVIFKRHTCTLLSIHIIKELIVQRSEHFIEIYFRRISALFNIIHIFCIHNRYMQVRA